MDIPEQLLPFRDRQQDPVLGFCPVCGREIYSDTCRYCEKEENNDCTA